MSAVTRIIFAGALATWVTGCLSLGQEEPRRYYVLEPAMDSALAQRANPRAAPLIVAPMSASAFYDTTEMVYSRAPGERAYYTQSSWTERPSRRLTDILMAHLQASEAFRTVALAGSGVQGDIVLNTHLAVLFHDAATPPGRVRVEIVAELVDVAQRRLIARQAFEQNAPARTYDAAGAVAAFNRATAAALDDIARWVVASVPR